MNTTEKKAFAISVVFCCITVCWNVLYLRDGSYWEPIKHISEGTAGGIFQYILSTIFIIVMSILEYLQAVKADENKMLWLEILVIPIVWPLKWLLIAIVMSLPNCFI